MFFVQVPYTAIIIIERQRADNSVCEFFVLIHSKKKTKRKERKEREYVYNRTIDICICFCPISIG